MRSSEKPEKILISSVQPPPAGGLGPLGAGAGATGATGQAASGTVCESSARISRGFSHEIHVKHPWL